MEATIRIHCKIVKTQISYAYYTCHTIKISTIIEKHSGSVEMGWTGGFETHFVVSLKQDTLYST